MPSFPWTARQDVSPVEDTSLAALLAGTGLSAGADAELRPVADVLAALTAGPAGDELTGLAAARAEFRRHVVPVQVRQAPRRRAGGLASRLAAAAAVVVMALGGAAAVAYAGALPGSWQQFAHRAIGAPVRLAGHETSAAAGAAGSAAHWQCAAYQRTQAHGTASQQVAALRDLVKAAGGPGKVTEWCATVARSRQPANGPRSSGPLAGHGFPRRAWPEHHAWLPARPSAHRGGPAGAVAARNTPGRPPWDGVIRGPLPRA